jgi:hypothetical protein
MGNRTRDFLLGPWLLPTWATDGWLWWFLVALGLTLRLLAAPFGENFDVQAWRYAADVSRSEWNVYLGTSYYNYGPIWFGLLAALKQVNIWLFADGFLSFRLLLAALLTTVDALIARWLVRNASKQAALLFLLNPVSILITGWHGQFCNLAILLGLLAVSRWSSASTNRQRVLALLLLGLSLTTKHLLFLFPIWLLLGERTWTWRFLLLAIPYGVFGLSFLPFVFEAWPQIYENVLAYKSFNNAPILHLFLPDTWLADSPLPRIFFFGGLLAAAWPTRFWQPVPRMAAYMVVLLLCSQAMTNQYLTIPTLFIALYPNGIFLLYAALASAWIVLDNYWYFLHYRVTPIFEPIYEALAPQAYAYWLLVLGLGFAATLWRRRDVFASTVGKMRPKA